MSSKSIFSTLLAIPHYPEKDPYATLDLDVLTTLLENCNIYLTNSFKEEHPNL